MNNQDEGSISDNGHPPVETVSSESSNPDHEEDQEGDGIPSGQTSTPEVIHMFNLGPDFQNQQEDLHPDIEENEPEGTMDHQDPGTSTSVNSNPVVEPEVEGEPPSDSTEWIDEMDSRPPENTIWFDDTEPQPRPDRRSSNPMNMVNDAARRQSYANFQSPLPRVSPLEQRHVNTPHTMFVSGGGGGGGGGGSSGSSSSSTGSRNGPPPSSTTSSGRSPPVEVSRPSPTPTPNPNAPPMMRPITIDGRPLMTRTHPVPVKDYIRSRTWNKYERSQMKSDERIAYDKAASGYVLPKTNKLRVQSRLTADEDVLKHVHNLQYQIKALRAHATEHDIIDVMTIVIPKNLKESPELEPQRYNLFDDYPKLTPTIVANSNAWYSRWIEHDFIADNLNLTFTLCKNNTEDTLFNKCLEEYETFHPMQRGGPLMMILVLLKIHNASEQHMEYLKLKVEGLKISTMEGEDVDTAVSLINSAYTTFKSISTKNHNRVPLEWPKTLIQVFQTTSVPEFNRVFKTEADEARRDADKNGGQPVWPTHEQLTKLASATYNRLKLSGEWDVPKAAKSKAYFGGQTGSGSRPPPSGRPTRLCWNCGSPDHMLPECPKPLDQVRVDKARQQFRTRSRGNAYPRRPQNKVIDGKPMVCNQKGAYVLDQRKVRAHARSRRVRNTLLELQHDSAALAHAPSPPPTPAPAAGSRPPSAAATSRTVDVASVQDVLRHLL